MNEWAAISREYADEAADYLLVPLGRIPFVIPTFQQFSKATQ
jgi:hypothetical protein